MPGLMPHGWAELDEQDDARLAAERTAFRRVAEIEPELQVHRSVRPSRAVIVGVLVIAAVIVLAVVAYRMAPP